MEVKRRGKEKGEEGRGKWEEGTEKGAQWKGKRGREGKRGKRKGKGRKRGKREGKILSLKITVFFFILSLDIYSLLIDKSF